jgi:hypothetical protein
VTEGTAPNPSTAQARVIVDEFARSGVSDVVLCPGSRSAPFAFAFDEEPRVRLHVHPDERSAAFVALGIAHVTGRPVAVVVTSGSAVANGGSGSVDPPMSLLPSRVPSPTSRSRVRRLRVMLRASSCCRRSAGRRTSSPRSAAGVASG